MVSFSSLDLLPTASQVPGTHSGPRWWDPAAPPSGGGTQLSPPPPPPAALPSAAPRGTVPFYRFI